MKSISCCLCLTALLSAHLLSPAPAKAEIVTYAFGGTFTQLGGGPRISELLPGMTDGDPVSGTLTYDSSSLGITQFAAGLHGITVLFDNTYAFTWTAPTAGDRIDVDNLFGYPGPYGVRFLKQAPPEQVSDSSGSVFMTFAEVVLGSSQPLLPPDPPPVGELLVLEDLVGDLASPSYDMARFLGFRIHGPSLWPPDNGAEISIIDAMHLDALVRVPEPSSLVMAACAGLGLLVVGRRRRCRAAASVVPTVALALCLGVSSSAQAVTINWTPVGNPGNAADSTVMTTDGTTGYGAVGYAYNIDKYEVTNGQYAEFLNAVGATDTYGLYNPFMSSDTKGGITQGGISGSYTYSVKPNYGNLPVVYVSWGDSARFANWLAHGQPSGAQNAATTEDGSYFLNGATSIPALSAVTRSSSATIVVPSENEWYKAAYYNPANSSYFQYPTSSNTVPSNAFLDAGNNANFHSGITYTTVSPYLTDVGHFATSESPYGTFDQGGNVFEWNEALIFGSLRGERGGAFSDNSLYLLSSNRGSTNPTNGLFNLGFRVATVPESGTLAMGVIALALVAALRLRRLRLRDIWPTRVARPSPMASPLSAST